MANYFYSGVALAKKKGDRIDVFEGPHTLADFMPAIVMAFATKNLNAHVCVGSYSE